ncbi:hypothetical protein ACJ72_04284 [Emergomyces africanus]|uniref:Carnitine O-acetyltransferase, mitochondrial n=1 Tax=Emergomyces africanus TaxID=1955775 RepID=A0A1B7NX70_9EURO|nr:hypothetical protein ACJ72_04284 [Emergomyces africanus]
MLRFEDSLPRLPVPALEETGKRYLKSVHPLLTESEFKKTSKAVEEFIRPGGEGEPLQKRLLARAADPKHVNWLYEWWNDAAYLAYRDPVVPYVSYFYSYRDDRHRRNPAKRAAAITTSVLEFKKQVDDGSLEPEYLRKEPMAMSSYQYMFNACRIPADKVDYPVTYPAQGNEHIIVIRKNQFFKLPTLINGQQLNTSELQQQFEKIYQNAEKVQPVGVLTSANRDFWTTARKNLTKASAVNQAALEAIQSASFAVCLDDASPVTLEERAHSYWHVHRQRERHGWLHGRTQHDGRHPTHRLNDYVNNMIFNNRLDYSNPEIRSTLPDPQPIQFELNKQALDDIATATHAFNTVIGQHELRVQAFQGYGKGLIKKFKCSPDATYR